MRVLPPSARARFDALTPRERLLLAVGTGALLLFLIFMILPATGSDDSVEIAAAPPVATPPPAPVIAPPPPVPAAPPPASPSGLILKGVLGSGAIIAFPTGGERLVPIGRELLPGLTLRSVGVLHAVVGGTGGDYRLELGKAGAVPATTAAPAQLPQRATVDYRRWLEPAQSGRVRGYAIKPGSGTAALQLAGMAPGDVIVSVNGAEVDEEMVQRLPELIASAQSLEVEFVRGERRMSVVVEPPRQ